MKDFFKVMVLLIVPILLIMLAMEATARTKGDVLGLVKPSKRDEKGLVYNLKSEITNLKKPKFLILEREPCFSELDCQVKLEEKICFQGSAKKNLDWMRVYCAWNVH